MSGSKKIYQLCSFTSLKKNDISKEAEKKDLADQLKSFGFFDIKIFKDGQILIHKPFEYSEPDVDRTYTEIINSYRVDITPRMYATAWEDYKAYWRSYLNPSRLLSNRIFSMLLAHLSILMFLEVVVLVISIRHSFSKLEKAIGKKYGNVS